MAEADRRVRLTVEFIAVKNAGHDFEQEVPYYGVRHVVRPGITGWAQVRYKYGNTVEDAKEKLQHDLFYIKNASLGLDLLIIFQTIKIVLLGRGSR